MKSKVYLIKITMLIFLLISFTQAHAITILNGKVLKVKDGDTVVISPIEGGQFYTCRLYGIDAPEVTHGHQQGQPYGEESSNALKKMILGQVVDVTLIGGKTYNREVCIIKKDGININLQMVRNGCAWAYKQYLKRPHASEYIDAEAQARKERKGLWQQTNPTPPWEFRRKNK